MKNPYNSAFLFLCSAILTSSVPAQIPAFPGAEGFGSTTPGGRGGQVIKVTNLNESGPGSFRAAVEASGPRIVVFEVGGTIDMQGRALRITNPYLTIAGQTAPGDGILLKDSDLKIMTHDVIIRGLRIRVGDSGIDPSDCTPDACIQRGILVGSEEGYNVVIDHNSISWGRGGNLYVFQGAHDITFSWNIVSEALRIDGSKGVTHHRTVGGRISTHHNVIASNRHRNPQVFAPHNEVVNNLVYNYGIDGANVWLPPGRAANLIGNVFLPGPDTDVNGTLKGISVTYSQDPRTGEIGTAPGTLYLERNIGPGREQIVSPGLDLNEEWQAVYADSGVTIDVLVTSRFEQSGITVHDPMELQQLLLGPQGAGAIVPFRDSVDERIINSIDTNTGQIILSQEEVGGWPQLNGGTPPADSDNDGMPDDWETANGLNPNDATDANSDADGDGYTNIEAYINGLIPLPGTPTGVEEGIMEIPADFVLQQNYPNPFNPSTTIRFSLSRKERVTLKVFDVLGREVVTLLNEERPAGEHSVIFDAKDLASGVYFYRLTAGPFTQIRKAILIR